MKIERLLIFLLVSSVYVSAFDWDFNEEADEDRNKDQEQDDDTCPENEVYSNCANCETTCSVTVQDPDCVCEPGCECESEFLRNSKGVCVPETKCDAPCENDYGKIYDPCGAVCQKTCDNINDRDYYCRVPKDCTNLGACRCQEGLVLNNGGQCVRVEDCPLKCGPNEAYSECMGGSQCEGTCDDPKKKWSCIYPFCRPGCTCAANFLRDENGVCTSGPECYDTCGGDPNARKIFCSPCGGRKTCSSLNDEGFSCVPECDGVKGCDCKSGYVLQSKKGRCIPIKDCPTCNGDNEAYLCRNCDLSYDNIDPYCVERDSCKDGCYCVPGYARDDQDNCVKLSEISQPPCDDDPNAYYEQCGLLCEEKTCKNKDTLPECTFKSCRLNGRCVCKPGYVKNSEGKCILPQNCGIDGLYKRSFLPPPPPPPPSPPPPPPSPIPTPTKFDCGPNEVYEENPQTCYPEDLTCDMLFQGEEQECYPDETSGPVCKCLPGFVRNVDEDCVPPPQCCDDRNSELVQNYNVCPGGTCDSPDFEECDSPAQPFGCQCKEGYVKISDEDSTCVLAEECYNY